MPIYEFYCQQCNTVYNFFSKTVNTEKIPCCPTCRDVKLERQMSIFSTISGDREEGEDDLPPIDEAKMGKAMEMLTREAEGIDEDDPRQAAKMMRKLAETTGLNLNDGMEEALSRIEGGEDPEQVEAEMGDLLDDGNPFTFDNKSKARSRKTRPQVDETLYDL